MLSLIPFKKYLIITAAVAVTALAFFVLFKLYKFERSERIRMQGNQNTLLDNLRIYKLSDSSSVATIGKLELSVKELKHSNLQEITDLKGTIAKLDIKLRHVMAATSTNFETVTTLNTHLRDSVIYDTIPIKYFSRSSRFNDVTLQIFPTFRDSLNMKVITRDTLTQIVHKVPKGFAFWKPRRIEQTIRFANPDTRIHFNRYIEIRKRRK